MSKRGHSTTYSIEPQRRARPGDGGWKLCLPHQAGRFAVVQLTVWREGRKQYRRTRVVASFTGAGAEAAANNAMQTLVAHGKPKPRPSLGSRFRSTGRKIIARSLTAAEYHARQEKKG